jgi:hypothetical protein
MPPKRVHTEKRKEQGKAKNRIDRAKDLSPEEKNAAKVLSHMEHNKTGGIYGQRVVEPRAKKSKTGLNDLVNVGLIKQLEDLQKANTKTMADIEKTKDKIDKMIANNK